MARMIPQLGFFNQQSGFNNTSMWSAGRIYIAET